MSGTPLGRGRACGKLILLGEHFVVHGSPALALPLPVVSTEVSVVDTGAAGPRLRTDASGDVEETALQMVHAALERLGLPVNAPWQIEVRSTVPPGHGLGSSAAFAVALLRALADASGATLALEELNAHAHALEGIVHGTPSGIDNTTISFERPVWFERSRPPSFLGSSTGPSLVLASSGQPGSTADAVASVHRLKADDPKRFDRLCASARQLVLEGREAFITGDLRTLGARMTENHQLLRELGVSTRILDRLSDEAIHAGAFGAKLTGGGRGGFIVAAVGPDQRERVDEALRTAGAALLLHVGACGADEDHEEGP
jgi:mevalonate kinase